MTTEAIQTSVLEAITRVKTEKPLLDFKAVHERSTAHRLAVHLELCFEAWNVDCEYDRGGQLRKTLLGIAQCKAGKKTDAVLPDIIVHHRSQEGREHNLLVIEMKKNAPEDLCDRKKLELLTDPAGHYQYQLGLYINIDGGNFIRKWFQEGQLLP
jgi:hypothetical protein